MNMQRAWSDLNVLLQHEQRRILMVKGAGVGEDWSVIMVSGTNSTGTGTCEMHLLARVSRVD